MPITDFESIPDFYRNYVSYVQHEDPLEALKTGKDLLHQHFAQISEAAAGYAYAEGKWTRKQVLQHLMDAERIFAYRALRFSRADATPVEGYDENLYAENTNLTIPLVQLLQEASRLRETTLDLFKSFTNDVLERKGIANGRQFSVRHLAFIIAGHERHHLRILQERYLDK